MHALPQPVYQEVLPAKVQLAERVVSLFAPPSCGTGLVSGSEPVRTELELKVYRESLEVISDFYKQPSAYVCTDLKWNEQTCSIEPVHSCNP